jgi:hypothetical protein
VNLEVVHPPFLVQRLEGEGEALGDAEAGVQKEAHQRHVPKAGEGARVRLIEQLLELLFTEGTDQILSHLGTRYPAHRVTGKESLFFQKVEEGAQSSMVGEHRMVRDLRPAFVARAASHRRLEFAQVFRGDLPEVQVPQVLLELLQDAAAVFAVGERVTPRFLEGEMFAKGFRELHRSPS